MIKKNGYSLDELNKIKSGLIKAPDFKDVVLDLSDVLEELKTIIFELYTTKNYPPKVITKLLNDAGLLVSQNRVNAILGLNKSKINKKNDEIV
jgi:hypothetical protein